MLLHSHQVLSHRILKALKNEIFKMFCFLNTLYNLNDLAFEILVFYYINYAQLLPLIECFKIAFAEKVIWLVL